MAEIKRSKLIKHTKVITADSIRWLLPFEERLSDAENDYSETQELLYLILGYHELIMDCDLDAWTCIESTTCRCPDCDNIYDLIRQI